MWFFIRLEVGPYSEDRQRSDVLMRTFFVASLLFQIVCVSLGIFLGIILLTNSQARLVLKSMSNFRSVLDAILSREKAEPILAPYFSKVQQCCLKGMEAWLRFAEITPDLRIPLLSRTMADFVNDWVVHYARSEFLDDRTNGVESFDERGFFCVGISRQIIMRFKKADDEDMARNYPTKQQIEIGGQQLIIPGWTQPTIVSACYHFTKTLDAIDRIVITCSFNGHRLWRIPVFDGNEGTETGVLPFGSPQAPQPRKSKVLPKDIKKPEGS